MADTFLSNLFNAVSEGQITPEVNNTKKYFLEGFQWAQ